MTQPAELDRVEAELTAGFEKLMAQAPALTQALKPFEDAPQMAPLSTMLPILAWVVRLELMLNLIDSEEGWARSHPEVAALLRKLREMTTPHPFYMARDAQLAAGPARYRIEEHLNSLSQGGLEQLAEALAQGGHLKVVVRK